NGEEWAAFTEAAHGVQRPVLFDALRRLRSGAGQPDDFRVRIRSKVKRYQALLKSRLYNGEHQQPGKREGVARDLINCFSDFAHIAAQVLTGLPVDLKKKLEAVAERARKAEERARGNIDSKGQQWHNNFSDLDLECVIEALQEVGHVLGLREDDPVVAEDAPIPFPIQDLPDFIQALASSQSSRDIAQFVDTLNLRIRSLLARGRLASVLQPDDAMRMTLEHWLTDYIGADQASNGSVVIIDLSLVPSEVIHIVVSVLARMIFEALQHYRRVTGHELPTVLVLEEAHTFVHRDLSEGKGTPAGQACSRVIERIAREGRKFGLGLVLASQRPSEISPTVLSQCNTFLLHRIVNDHDQELVKRLVPDGLGALLRELPSLPTGRAILLGWASPAPVVVEVRELPNEQRPQSADPAFWGVWVGEEERLIDWKQIAEAWRGDGWKGMQAADKDIPADGESIGVDCRLGRQGLVSRMVEWAWSVYHEPLCRIFDTGNTWGCTVRRDQLARQEMHVCAT